MLLDDHSIEYIVSTAWDLEYAQKTLIDLPVQLLPDNSAFLFRPCSPIDASHGVGTLYIDPDNSRLEGNEYAGWREMVVGGGLLELDDLNNIRGVELLYLRNAVLLNQDDAYIEDVLSQCKINVFFPGIFGNDLEKSFVGIRPYQTLLEAHYNPAREMTEDYPDDLS